MLPEISNIELALQDLLEFKVEKISATESKIVVSTKLPHGTLITKSKITTNIRTGTVNKEFAIKGANSGF